MEYMFCFVITFKSNFVCSSKMEKFNYEEKIRQLSSAYDKRGRVAHDELLDSLRKEIGESPYKILNKVIIEDYLDKKGANRLFGAFPEWELPGLIKKCQDLEDSFNKPLR